MDNKYRIWVFLALLVPFSSVADGITVEVMQVYFKEYFKKSSFSGLVGYKKSSDLSFKVDGVIAEFLPEEGRLVKKGEVLASLVSDEIDARVEEAESKVQLLKNTLDRYQTLYEKRLLPLQQLDQVQADLKGAESQLKIVDFNQQRSKILSPYDGIVLKVFYEKSELVQPFQPIIKVASTSEPWVIRIDVTEQLVSRIAVMDQVSIHFDMWPDRSVVGHINTVGQPKNESTGLFPVEVIFNEPVYGIRAGYSATVEIARPSYVAMIPIQAIIGMKGTDKADVLIYQPETGLFHKQGISIAYINGNQVAVKAGLNDGQFVITRGASYLTDWQGIGNVIFIDR